MNIGMEKNDILTIMHELGRPASVKTINRIWTEKLRASGNYKHRSIQVTRTRLLSMEQAGIVIRENAGPGERHHWTCLVQPA